MESMKKAAKRSSSSSKASPAKKTGKVTDLKTAFEGDKHALEDQIRPSPRLFKAVKRQITLRVDVHVIERYRHRHQKYQTVMNAVLREEMRSTLHAKAVEKARGR
jgi:uncharacterized protein (DUF4415 family)